MDEDIIYILSKKWFIKNNFVILGGQPPNGSDNIPVIEIKDSFVKEKGSKGSYKPDLICANSNFILLIECKPEYSFSDEKKLLSVENDITRKKLLYDEIVKRNLFERKKIFQHYSSFELMKNKLRYCLCYSGEIKKLNKIASLIFNKIDIDGDLHLPHEKNYFFTFD